MCVTALKTNTVVAARQLRAMLLESLNAQAEDSQEYYRYGATDCFYVVIAPTSKVLEICSPATNVQLNMVLNSVFLNLLQERTSHIINKRNCM